MERILLVTAVAAGLALALLVVVPPGIHSGDDAIPVNVLGSPRIAEENERTIQLDQRLGVSVRARDERSAIVAQLEAGEIELSEAIERFRPLNDLDPACKNVICACNPGFSDDEVAAYQLIVFADAKPADDPEQRQAFLRRLTIQVRERFGRTVPLPAHLAASLK